MVLQAGTISKLLYHVAAVVCHVSLVQNAHQMRTKCRRRRRRRRRRCFQVPEPGFVSKAYAKARREELSPPFGSAAAPMLAGVPPGAEGFPYASMPEGEENGTTHFSVVDRFGTLIAYTTTIENNWGSGVVVPGRGFLLNNEMTDFSATAVDPSTGLPFANRPEGGKRPRRTALGQEDQESLGGKRPRSSMSPTIVVEADGTPLLATGSPGGSTIIAATTSMLVNLLDLFRGEAEHGLPSTDAELSAVTVMGRTMAQNTGSATVEPAGLAPPGGGGGPGSTSSRAGDNARWVLEARGFNISCSGVGLVQTVMVVPSSGAPPLLIGACDTTRQYQGESNCLAQGF